MRSMMKMRQENRPRASQENEAGEPSRASQENEAGEPSPCF